MRYIEISIPRITRKSLEKHRETLPSLSLSPIDTLEAASQTAFRTGFSLLRPSANETINPALKMVTLPRNSKRNPDDWQIANFVSDTDDGWRFYLRVISN